MTSLDCDLWVIEPHALQRLTAFVMSGVRPPIDENVRAAAAAASQKPNAVGLIRIHGALEARPTEMGAWLGMASYEQIGEQFDALINHDGVSSVVLDIMSPGGMVYGAQELANKIYDARGKGKPIIAVANPMAASGAYWLAAAAHRIVSTPSADVGSVGVFWQHVDLSQLYQAKGVKITTIRSVNSPHKAEGVDSEPLSDDSKDYMQGRADRIYSQFVGDLSKFRGIPVEHINEHFGKGRVVDSGRAAKAGMIDRVDSLFGVVAKLQEGRVRLGSASAQDVWDGLTIQEARMHRIKALSQAAEV